MNKYIKYLIVVTTLIVVYSSTIGVANSGSTDTIITSSEVIEESGVDLVEESQSSVIESSVATDTESDPAWLLNLPVTQDFKSHVHNVAEYYGFDEKLIYQIIYRESSFNPDSDNGLCQGLMQINKNYLSHYASMHDNYSYLFSAEWSVFDPYVNVVLGCRVLADWRKMATSSGYNTITDWLSFYNQGWAYKSTSNTNYARRVMNTLLESIDFSNTHIVG